MTARLLLEYDGAAFSGWATQPGKRTVQETVETALATARREPVTLVVAGRTDAGVHARGQVASHTGEAVPAYTLNGLLPPDVRVLASDTAGDDFDARKDARSRLYRYRVLTGAVAGVFERDRAMHCRVELDRDLLDACAALLAGKHDFTAFTPSGGYHRHFDRTVTRSEWLDEAGGVVAFWIEADTFMRNMVRVLVGTMLAVAGGRMTIGDFEHLLDGAPRSEAANTAPPHGLYLESVRY